MSWQLGSTLLVTVALAAGFAWYERSRPPSRLVALVAALAALAVAGRVLFAPIPNVQATTDVVLLSGYALGPLPGLRGRRRRRAGLQPLPRPGPLDALADARLGDGGRGGSRARGGLRPAARAVAARARLRAAGFAFGAWMDLFTLVTFAAESSTAGYLAVAGVSFPFNVAHAIGNALLCLALGPAFVRMLVRFRDRMQVEWVSLEQLGGAGTAGVALARAGARRCGGRTACARPTRPLRYLARAQNSDGGFGGARGQPSNQLLTGWAAIGLEAAGRNPLDVRRSGKTPIDYMRAHLAQLKDTGELERTILALRGRRRRQHAGPRARPGRRAARAPRRRRLVRAPVELDGVRDAGSAGGGAVARARAPSAAPPPGSRASRTTTAASRSRRAGAAASWTRPAPRCRRWPPRVGAGVRRSHARSHTCARRRTRTAASGRARASAPTPSRPPGRCRGSSRRARTRRGSGARAVRRSRSSRSLQPPDGSYRYSRTSAQTPVWVTAQALAAVRRKALPLRPVPRRPKPARARRQVVPGAGAGEADREARQARGSRAAPCPVPRPSTAPRSRHSAPRPPRATVRTPAARSPARAAGNRARGARSRPRVGWAFKRRHRVASIACARVLTR